MKRELIGDEDGHIEAALDTIRLGKQALIFFSSRRSAEKGADDIAAALRKRPALSEGLEHDKLSQLGDGIEKALSAPTKQCRRLAKASRAGAAFHHSGLAGKQRSLVEDAFRDKTLRVICATPTLAAGVDLPSFRTIIRDAKRFSNYGMQYIPVLEYLQMAGRSGRPSYDDYGECVLIAKSPAHKQELYEKYILGEPEDITSKLAAEPALRTHVLALIANQVVGSRKELEEFIAETFYAHQFRDASRLSFILDKIIHFLTEEGFISGSEGSSDDPFMSAAQIGGDTLSITPLGKRVSELYLDPLSASSFVRAMRSEKDELIGYLHLLSSMLELRPLPSVRQKDQDEVESLLAQSEGKLLLDEPSYYSEGFDEYLKQAKLTIILLSWLEEASEDDLYERYDISPGHLYGKLDLADWLCYAGSEIAAVLNKPDERKRFQKLRMLLKYGIGEELLPLVRIRDIGRKRARQLYTHGIRSATDIAQAPLAKLSTIVGEKIALKLKERTRDARVFDTQRRL